MRGKIDSPKTQINDRSLFVLGTHTAIESVGGGLVLWNQTSTIEWICEDAELSTLNRVFFFFFVSVCLLEVRQHSNGYMRPGWLNELGSWIT